MIPVLALLAGCGEAPSPGVPAPEAVADTGTAPDPDAALVPLEAPRLLRRMSLDLRGVLPSVEELDAVEADPAQLEVLRDAFLEDPRHEERLVTLFGERWHTQTDEFLVYYVEYPELASDGNNEYPFERAVGEEPLRVLARVGASDEPWTTVVTADWTMANELLAAIWPIDYPDGATGWQQARYSDGRPAAGVLGTNGLWWRYYTTVSNLNRGRAAAIARLLLCVDYLSRPVSFSESTPLLDEDGIEEALRSNPYCMGCHSSLDPVAATLFGFWTANEYNVHEMHEYHAEREPMGELALGVAPEWYGTPITGLNELGEVISQDPRFAACTAETAANLLWRREVESADFGRVDALRQAWLDGDGTFASVLRAATDGAAYRAGGLDERATDADLARENTVRMVDAALLESVLQDLAGLDWRYRGFEQLDNDTWGYRILGGAVDGVYVTRPQRTPSLTWTLTAQRAAEMASWTAVTRELEQAGERYMFRHVSRETRPGEDAFDAELRDLWWRLFAVRPTDDDVAALASLWLAVEPEAGATSAWRAVLVALLRDPHFLTY